jgi:hypothetical protein
VCQWKDKGQAVFESFCLDIELTGRNLRDRHSKRRQRGKSHT